MTRRRWAGLKSVSTLVVLCICSIAGVALAEYKRSHLYAEFYRGDHHVMTLDYEIHKDGHQVRWRVTNQSSQSFYNVGIEGKTYTLTDGTAKRGSAETCGKSELPSGESCVTMWDAIGSGDKPKVADVAMAAPYVNLAPSPSAARVKASDVFEVKLQ